MQERKTLEERIEAGRDAIRLIEQHSMTVAQIARRKGVPHNTIKNWISDARSYDGSR